MASMSTKRLSTASSSSSGQKYDVFISFRGEDNRKSFTDHLQSALKRGGINVFRDEKMERGKSISEELFNAIEASRISIIVLSRKYASSTWCLDELVKIVQCRNDMGQTIIPVYYDVSSSEVKEGIFEEAFIKHEETKDPEKVQTWRSAMRELTNLHEWELGHRRESELIADVVEDISMRLHASGSRFMNLMMIASGLKSSLEKLRMQADANLSRLRWGPLAAITEIPFFFFL